MENAIKTIALFGATAVAEIFGCYPPYLWLQGRVGMWVLLPAAISLVAFVWLLSLHPSAAGRTYAAYGLHLRGDRPAVVVGSRWHSSRPLGRARRRAGARRYGGHRIRSAYNLRIHILTMEAIA